MTAVGAMRESNWIERRGFFLGFIAMESPLRGLQVQTKQ